MVYVMRVERTMFLLKKEIDKSIDFSRRESEGKFFYNFVLKIFWRKA